jgi:hypothetical protein
MGLYLSDIQSRQGGSELGLPHLQYGIVSTLWLTKNLFPTKLVKRTIGKARNASSHHNPNPTTYKISCTLSHTCCPQHTPLRLPVQSHGTFGVHSFQKTTTHTCPADTVSTLADNRVCKSIRRCIAGCHELDDSRSSERRRRRRTQRARCRCRPSSDVAESQVCVDTLECPPRDIRRTAFCKLSHTPARARARARSPPIPSRIPMTARYGTEDSNLNSLVWIQDERSLERLNSVANRKQTSGQQERLFPNPFLLS